MEKNFLIKQKSNDMKINKFFLILLAAFSPFLNLKAQQVPVSTQFIYNGYLYNPARAGQNTQYGLAFIDFKKQWTALPDAPITGIATFDSRIKESNVGLGGYLFTDNTSIVHEIGGSFSYAYHVPFNKEKTHNLSIGLSTGIIHQRFDFTEAIVDDPNDPTISNDNERSLAFDLSAGVDYQWKGLHVGIAAPQLYNNTVRFRDAEKSDITFKYNRHLFAYASYKQGLGKKKEVSLEPLVAVRWVKGLPAQFDIELLANWKDMVWLGGGYRSANSFVKAEAAGWNVTGGAGIKQRVGINYSLEMLANKANRNSFGYSHEVSIAYKIGNRYQKEFKKLDETADKVAGLDAKTNQLEKDAEEAAADAQATKEQLEKGANDLTNLSNQVKDNKAALDKMQTIINEYNSGTAVSYKKLGSVYFNLDSYELTKEAKASLDALKNPLDKFTSNSFVYVVGNASYEANNMYNLLLATQRAASVKKYLDSIGVNKEVIILSAGEESPINGQTSEGQKALNRRADILISGE